MELEVTNSWVAGSFPLPLYEAIDTACSAPIHYPAYKKMMEYHVAKAHRTRQSWCRWCLGYKTHTPIHWVSRREVVKCLIPTGLLPRLTNVLHERGVFPSVLDLRQRPTRLMGTPPAISMRDYQQDVADATAEAPRGMWQAPVGSGKTRMLVAAALERDVRSLLIVPSRQIMEQFVEAHEELAGAKPGVIGGGKCEPADITIGLLPMLAKHRGEPAYKALMETLGLVGIDEFHHGAARTWFEVIQDTDAYYRYGQSATLHREDGMDIFLEAAVGPTLARVNEGELIDQGWLARPLVRVVHVPGCLREDTFRAAEDQNIFGSSTPISLTHAICASHAADKVIVLVTRIPFGAELATALADGTRSVGWVNGKTKASETKEVIATFRREPRAVLVTTQMLDEGFDAPDANVLVLPCGGKSEIKHKQRIGRVMRPKEGTNEAVVYDVVYHDTGFLYRHGMTRMRRYRTWGWPVQHYTYRGGRIVQDEADANVYATAGE